MTGFAEEVQSLITLKKSSYSLHTLGSERQFWTPFKLHQKQKIKALSKDLGDTYSYLAFTSLITIFMHWSKLASQ